MIISVVKIENINVNMKIILKFIIFMILDENYSPIIRILHSNIKISKLVYQ